MQRLLIVTTLIILDYNTCQGVCRLYIKFNIELTYKLLSTHATGQVIVL